MNLAYHKEALNHYLFPTLLLYLQSLQNATKSNPRAFMHFVMLQLLMLQFPSSNFRFQHNFSTAPFAGRFYGHLHY